MTRSRSPRRRPPAVPAILLAYPDMAATVEAMQDVFGDVTLMLVDEDRPAHPEQGSRGIRVAEVVQ